MATTKTSGGVKRGYATRTDKATGRHRREGGTWLKPGQSHNNFLTRTDAEGWMRMMHGTRLAVDAGLGLGPFCKVVELPCVPFNDRFGP